MLFKKNIYTLIFQTQMTRILFIGIQRLGILLKEKIRVIRV